MGLHNDQACSDWLAWPVKQMRGTGNLSELPRSKAEIQGWFAGVALARSRIDAAA